MSDRAMNIDRVLDLAEAVCSKDASENDFVELDSLLHTDRESRSHYLNYCWMHVSLRLQLRARRAVQKAHQQIDSELPPPVSVDSSAESVATTSATSFSFLTTTLHGTFQSTLGFFSSGWPVAYLIATVIFSIGLLVGAFTYVSQPGEVAVTSSTRRTPIDEPRAEFVARITGMVDCRQAPDVAPSLVDSALPVGHRINLESGLMEITYDVGAKVLLQGPVTYEVESASGGYLSLGKLTARLEKKVASGQWPVASEKSEISNPQSLIPNPSSPAPRPPSPVPLFSVRTPTATVTDLGTEFGVEVSKGGHTTSYVFRGKVQVQSAARDSQQGQSFQLSKNESARVEKQSSGGLVVRRVAVDPAGFIRVEQLPKLVKERKLTPLRRWQAYSQELRRDPALVAYYTFEKHELASTTLPNQSAAGNVLDGKVEGAEWVYGRLPGKLALLFHGPRSGDIVTLPEHERFNFTGPFSVAVWFKVDKFTVDHQALLTKGDNAWRLQQRDDGDGGQLRFATNDSARVVRRTDGHADVADRRWHLAVGVFEPMGKTASQRLYIDGRLDAEITVRLPMNHNSEAVTIGGLPAGRNRTFQGWIDEVAVFSRAISAKEIETMFAVGSPTAPPEKEAASRR